MNNTTNNKICFLISTFDERDKYLDPFFFFFKKTIGKKYPIYLARETKYEIKEDINLIQINKKFKRTNKNLGLCSSRGQRLKYALKQIQNDGFKYIIRIGDDMRIQEVNKKQLNQLTIIIEKYNADRLQLCCISPGYSYKILGDNLLFIDPKKTMVPRYLNHQTSLRKIKSLYEATKKNDCATKNERIGSKRAKRMNHKYLSTKNPIIKSTGVVHSNEGLSRQGETLLREYCTAKNIDYIKLRQQFPYKKKKKLGFLIKNLPGYIYYKFIKWKNKKTFY